MNRFVLAGTGAGASVGACGVGRDDARARWHETSLGHVCGEPVGRGARCLPMNDGRAVPIDGAAAS